MQVLFAAIVSLACLHSAQGVETAQGVTMGHQANPLGKAVLVGADYSLVQTIVASLRGQSKSTKCGPNTKVFISDSQDAAGDQLYTEVTTSDGTCVAKGVTTITHLKFCGPGTLTISRLSCGRHDYKSHSFEHSSTEYTTNCEIIDLKGTNVDGYFGSLIVSC